MKEIPVGRVTHYYPRVGAAAVELQREELHLGDEIRIVGHGHDVRQRVDSMELDHEPIEAAEPEMNVGIKTVQPVHEKDVVYKVEKNFVDRILGR